MNFHKGCKMDQAEMEHMITKIMFKSPERKLACILLTRSRKDDYWHHTRA